MYNGVINVYKEPGYTSFDVVARLRGILKQKKIGHTGTLDPDAEGVLVVCLGNATKLCDILTDKDKSYVATLLLGITTDTEDVSGQVLSKNEVNCSEEEIKDVIMSYVCEYEQIPPMYSAIKVNGKKLYELAREGKVIERTPRKVVIHNIEIMDINLPRVKFKISCGKGTYIRSLCRDIGNQLGCGGVMEHLLRDSVFSTETGKQFLSADALSLNDIEKIVSMGDIDRYILPVEDMFPDLKKLHVTEAGNKKLQNGNFLGASDFVEKNVDFIRDSKFLVYSLDNIFTAIYKYDISKQILQVDKMFKL